MLICKKADRRKLIAARILVILFLIFSVGAGAQETGVVDSVRGTIAVADSMQGTGRVDSTLLKTGPSPDSLRRAQQASESILTEHREFSAEEIIRGERLFYGLAYSGTVSVSCVKCHNTAKADTLNWNPDALEISEKYLERTAADLKRVLLRPAGKKMAEVHSNFQFTNEDIVLIKAYMDRFVDIGIRQKKPVVTNLIILIVSFVLLLVSLVDFVLKKLFRNQTIHKVVIPVTTVIITWILVANAIAFGHSDGFSPDQPVKFSHAVHAGQNQTDCIYCHYSARSGKSAGIPPGNVCHNCHFLVRSGTRSGVTEISKVLAAYDSSRSVPWVRIYKLPDFVYFNHSQHVTAGEIACETCHGDVKTMDRLVQVPNLGMGWCLKCHDSRKVNLTNEYYKAYFERYYDSLMAGKIDSVMVSVTGGRNCGNCHY